jgi:hypothetical protein
MTLTLTRATIAGERGAARFFVYSGPLCRHLSPLRARVANSTAQKEKEPVTKLALSNDRTLLITFCFVWIILTCFCGREISRSWRKIKEENERKREETAKAREKFSRSEIWTIICWKKKYVKKERLLNRPSGAQRGVGFEFVYPERPHPQNNEKAKESHIDY